MFLIRAIFWLSLVVAFIPVNPEDLGPEQRAVSTRETIGALQMTVADLGAFCERNPQPCDTGRELALQFGAKARNGAHYVQNFLDRHVGSRAETEPDRISTGSVAK